MTSFRNFNGQPEKTIEICLNLIKKIPSHLPVVPLYPRPKSISATPPCCIEDVDPVLSDRAKLKRSLVDPFICVEFKFKILVCLVRS